MTNQLPPDPTSAPNTTYASTMFTPFRVGRYIQRPDGSVMDQAQRFPVRFLVHGDVLTYGSGRRHRVLWDDPDVVAGLNREIARLCARYGDARVPWSAREQTWLRMMLHLQPRVTPSHLKNLYARDWVGRRVVVSCELFGRWVRVCTPRSESDIRVAIMYYR
ncbi:uncharacterized protein K452DRAFT_302352 [Aplosporella prunicola CBS 121167]|uniref:Uncharacterized protein n=1 Tax=Aplosporella prunicola CBS 121167 TaxID=1176127 RepID=A0A6A6B1R7_9PEZI|nr:uncharacterized protein K452DRAFT_302352 [Aplosporella prunicola CBS 121167]KAF2136957.1 hypothetical protein K452DRAFT_302352 [Aplosporella prunicola CBS 121167]